MTRSGGTTGRSGGSYGSRRGDWDHDDRGGYEDDDDYGKSRNRHSTRGSSSRAAGASNGSGGHSRRDDRGRDDRDRRDRGGDNGYRGRESNRGGDRGYSEDRHRERRGDRRQSDRCSGRSRSRRQERNHQDDRRQLRDDDRRQGRDDRCQEERANRERQEKQEEERRKREKEKEKEKETDKDKDKDKDKEREKEKEKEAEEQKRREQEKEREASNSEERRKREEQKERERAKEAEDRRKRQIDDVFQKEAEEMARREFEAQQKRSSEFAILRLRQAFLKVHSVSVEGYGALVQELTEKLTAESDALGSQRQRLEDELTRALALAKQRVDRLSATLKVEVEAKQKAESTKMEAERLVTNLTQLVETAEGKVDILKSLVAPLDQTHAFSTEELNLLMASIREHANEAEVAQQSCFEFAHANRMMQNAQQLLGDSILPQIRNSVVALGNRVTEAAAVAKAAVIHAESLKSQLLTKASAKDSEQRENSLFLTYDADADGVWSKQELSTYTKSEFDFDLDPDTLDSIFGSLASDTSGVGFQDLSLARSLVGVARYAARERFLKEQKAAYEQQVEVLRVNFKEQMDSIDIEGRAFDGALADIEPKVFPIMSVVKRLEITEDFNGVMDELAVLVEEVDNLLSDAALQMTGLLSHVEDAAESEAAATPELRDWVQLEVKKVRLRTDWSKSRLDDITFRTKPGRDAVKRRHAMAFERIEQDVVKYLRREMEEKALSVEALFAAVVAGSTSGSLSGEQFAQFLKEKCACKVDDDHVGLVFKGMVSSSTGEASEEDFTRLVQLSYKVVEQTVLTSGLHIKESSTLRRLPVGEVILVREGPLTDPGVGVMRVRGKVISDGQMGWITVQGNQGTAYLELGGSEYEVMEGMDLTRDAEGSASVRPLERGELLNVLDWGARDELGSRRMKVQLKTDAATGWITKVDGGADLRML